MMRLWIVLRNLFVRLFRFFADLRNRKQAGHQDVDVPEGAEILLQEPPPHWLARRNANTTPQHWLEYIQQRAPNAVFRYYRVEDGARPAPGRTKLRPLPSASARLSPAALAGAVFRPAGKSSLATTRPSPRQPATQPMVASLRPLTPDPTAPPPQTAVNVRPALWSRLVQSRLIQIGASLSSFKSLLHARPHLPIFGLRRSASDQRLTTASAPHPPSASVSSPKRSAEAPLEGLVHGAAPALDARPAANFTEAGRVRASSDIAAGWPSFVTQSASFHRESGAAPALAERFQHRPGHDLAVWQAATTPDPAAAPSQASPWPMLPDATEAALRLVTLEDELRAARRRQRLSYEQQGLLCCIESLY